MDMFNQLNLMKSIKNLKEDEEVTSILVNYPALLLRKKCPLYPNGRTSYRFKRELRKLVTIIGKSSFTAVMSAIDKKIAEDAEKAKPVIFTEVD